MPHPREFDVLLLGATGITGRNALVYLAGRTAETGQSWAVGARNVARVRELCRDAGIATPPVFDVRLGETPLAAFTARGRVLINLAGPYTAHGGAVVRACVETVTSYVDLTGETQFLRRTDATWHDAAVAAGIAIVQTSGFEALPADLAVDLARAALATRGKRLVAVDARVSVRRAPGARMSDGISGGTARSILQVLAERERPRLGDVAFRVGDEGDRQRVRAASPVRLRPRVSAGTVVGPMIPSAFLNPPVIHRTAWLLARERAEPLVPLRYREGVPYGSARGASGVLALLAAGVTALVQAASIGVGRLPWPIRRGVASLLGRISPASGIGPTGPALELWHWQLRLRGASADGTAVRVRIDADGHPGYATTARMIGELALILADGSGTGRTGCITPALAVGARGADRFAAAGMRFTTRLPGAGAAAPN